MKLKENMTRARYKDHSASAVWEAVCVLNNYVRQTGVLCEVVKCCIGWHM